jgi:hypothetical protein
MRYWVDLLMPGVMSIVWCFKVVLLTVIITQIICDTVSKAIIKVCRELKTISIKER